MNSPTEGALRQGRLFRAVTVVALVFAVLVVPGRADAGPGGDAGYAAALVNESRAAHGLGPLTWAWDLQVIADRQAEAMAAEGRIYHSDLGSQLGWGWWGWSENVGYGPSVGWIHGAFLNSPHHAGNMLSWSYNYFGVGVAYGRDGSVYVAQVFGAW